MAACLPPKQRPPARTTEDLSDQPHARPTRPTYNCHLQLLQVAFCSDPMSGAQYCGNNQYAPQKFSYDPNFYMASSQQTSNPQQMFTSQRIANTQQYSTINFGGQSFQTPLNPADATLHNWAMATTHENSRLGSDMFNNRWCSNQAFVLQASFQQASAQQTVPTEPNSTSHCPADISPTISRPFQPKDDSKHETYDDHAIYDMDKDAGAHSFGELNGASCSNIS
ncbi:hypothetical protein D6C98_09493 [Aureobasidium pullulans]|nr:hypothetical protein D6C98_09493 [Aureobasidium pullulans]